MRPLLRFIAWEHIPGSRRFYNQMTPDKKVRVTKMIIGILHFELILPCSNSLKDKRAILNRIKSRIKNNYNISIAETDSKDKWSRAILAAVTVSSEKIVVDQLLEKVIGYIKSFPEVQLINYEVEII